MSRRDTAPAACTRSATQAGRIRSASCGRLFSRLKNVPCSQWLGLADKLPDPLLGNGSRTTGNTFQTRSDENSNELKQFPSLLLASHFTSISISHAGFVCSAGSRLGAGVHLCLGWSSTFEDSKWRGKTSFEGEHQLFCLLCLCHSKYTSSLQVGQFENNLDCDYLHCVTHSGLKSNLVCRVRNNVLPRRVWLDLTQVGAVLFLFQEVGGICFSVRLDRVQFCHQKERPRFTPSKMALVLLGNTKNRKICSVRQFLF